MYSIKEMMSMDLGQLFQIVHALVTNDLYEFGSNEM